jgi:2-oxoglutarate dehydrogenase E1 component
MATTSDISVFIADNFGANATYVESLLARFHSDPNSVDESWRNYFSELTGAPATAQPTNGHAAAPVAPVQAQPQGQAAAPAPVKVEGEAQPIRGAALKIVENMETSLTVPTATSVRRVPVKVLEENRRILNAHLASRNAGKASFTHLIAWACVRAFQKYPNLNDGFTEQDGQAVRVKREDVNLGVAVDIAKKDGSRSLMVPNVKAAQKMNFAQFLAAYDDVVKRARDNKLQLPDFQGTTLSLTNPGTIGTVSSMPRLMAGQSVIIATGAIEYPAEYHAMTDAVLSQLGISKTLTVSSTYDHRVIQGAESGELLKYVHELLIGQHDFYTEVFQSVGLNLPPMRWAKDYNPQLLGGDHVREQTIKQARVLELINAYRVRGHLFADIDPLHAMPVPNHPELDIENYGLTIWDLDREFITGGLAKKESMTLRETLEVLRRAYCGTVGTEYRHIMSKEQKSWIREQIYQHFVAPQSLAPEVKKALLRKLIEAEQFEKFLHTKFLGQKRFSLEGCETIVPLLDQLVEGAAARGVNDIVFGMAHRGRLNVLENIIGDYAERLFTIFEGSSHPAFPADEGDVKYHQGADRTRPTANGHKIRLQLSPNPSHLEFVDPVVEGIVRAKQDKLMHQEGKARDEAIDLTLPVLLHGDAAFAGQGIVMETLNLADLGGYGTGGTIHIIINNQIGFTTTPEKGRSTIYSTDIARMTQLPIFHINGDDPEAAYRVMQIALNFRQEFNHDVALDVVGFRKLGHNEADEPSYTQPLMYARVKEHPGVRHIYAEKLIREGVITAEELGQMTGECVAHYEEILAGAKQIVAGKTTKAELRPPVTEEDGSTVLDTAITTETVQAVGRKIALVPETFHINPKMVSQLTRRAKMADGEAPMDWAFAEAIAFGSLVLEGTSVRLSGQDSGRGTFSQRHAMMYDIQTGEAWCPLSEIRSAANPAARFHVWDSSLSEEGVLGFEYGYSVTAPDDLVIWEAQFGDFANGAQVIIDQYIAASEDKWKQYSRLTMLLPHGYEGQGPEHSSARLERYLQLCAENNLQVCYPTTPAQYFHLLRRQVRQATRRPLIVMTPKSLLRLPAASSIVAELTNGGFRPVLDDSTITDRAAVKRLVLCSGKVYYDLLAAREKAGLNHVALARLEQFYPFPAARLRELFDSYPNARLVWAQEEPKNMGGWAFLEPRLTGMTGYRPFYAARNASASPATGSYAIHHLEHEHLMETALTGNLE